MVNSRPARGIRRGRALFFSIKNLAKSAKYSPKKIFYKFITSFYLILQV